MNNILLEGPNMLLQHFSSCLMCVLQKPLESLSKTLVSVSLVQTDLLFLVARGVMGQPESYFLYLFVTRRQQIETSFSCLRR